MTDRVLKIYEDILATAGCTVEDGYVSQVLAGESDPVLIDGQRLALPTKERLKNSDKASTVLFHPLNEHLSRGESKVVQKLRGLLNTRLDYTLGIISYQLMKLATSTAQHKKLNPDQTEFLSKVKNASETTLKTLEKLMKNKPVDGVHKTIISIFLKRSGVAKGKSFHRVGVVSFPIYEALKASKKKCMDVTISDKDRDTIMALFEYMIPGIEEDGAYNVGSNSDVAPNLDALMHAVAGVASAVNGLLELFKNVFTEPEEFIFKDDWAEEFDNLSSLINDIRMTAPMQAGNEGTKEGTTSKAAAVEAQPEVAKPYRPWETPQIAPPVSYQPPPPPAVPRTDRGIDFAALSRTNPAQFQPQGYQGQGYPQPQQFNQQIRQQFQQFPQYQQPVYQPQPQYAPQPQQFTPAGTQRW